MVYVSGGNFYMKRDTLYQQDRYFNHGDVSSVNGFINSHSLYQCNYSSNFKQMDENVENCGASCGHGYINIHTLYQQNNFKPLINLNNRDDIEMNYDLNNDGVSSVVGSIKIHTISQFNELSYFNGLYWCVENGDVSGGNIFMESHTLSE